MKKILLLPVFILVILGINQVSAKELSIEEYENLNIKHSFVVGDYLFDMDNGYSPSLQDIMRASRSIPAGEPTTLYEVRIFPSWGFYSFNEIYKNITLNGKENYIPFNIRYVYRNNIKNADSKDYDELS